MSLAAMINHSRKVFLLVSVLAVLSTFLVVGVLLAIRLQVNERRSPFVVSENADLVALHQQVMRLHLGPEMDEWQRKETLAALDRIIQQLENIAAPDEPILLETNEIRSYYQAIAMSHGEQPSDAKAISGLCREVEQALSQCEMASTESLGALMLAVQLLARQSIEKEEVNRQLTHIETMVAGKLQPADESGFRKMLSGTRHRLELIGSTLDLRGETLTGETLDLADLRGRVVLIECWSTHCAPCVEAMPALKNAYARFHKQGFEIIGLPTDPYPGKLIAFAKQHQIAWSQIFDRTGNLERMQAWGIQAIPSSILIGRDGRVIALDVHAHASEPDRDLNRWLKKLLSP